METVTSRDYRALAALRYELRTFAAFSETAARGEGVEPRQHQLMLAIKGLEPGERPSVGVLAKQLLLQPNSAVELIKRSVECGLVATERAADDGRVVLVRVTPHGEAILVRLSRAHREELRSLAPRLVGTLRDLVGEPIG
jgi:DNA-binding MarR family transcriptional regulator